MNDEGTSKRIFPHLVDEWIDSGEDVVPYAAAISSVANKLKGSTTIIVDGAPDGKLLSDCLNKEPYRSVKDAADTYNITSINRLDRALTKISVALLQATGYSSLDQINRLGANEQDVLRRNMKEFLGLDLDTGQPVTDGPLDRWVKMYDPYWIMPDDADDSDPPEPPMTMVYIGHMDPYWWDGFMQVRDLNVKRSERKYARLNRFTEMRRLGKMQHGVKLLDWLKAS